MSKIQQVSWYFKKLFQILFVLLPILVVLTWMYASPTTSLLGNDILFGTAPHNYPIFGSITLDVKLLAMLASLIPLGVNLFVLYFLIQLFGLYEQGQIFTSSNVRYIRNIGYSLLIGQLINPIYQGLLSLILTLHNPEGMHFIAVTLSGTNLGILLTAILVILISWIMAEGYKLQEEQQLTV